MLEIKDFRFQTNVSYEGYQCKSDASACLSTPGAKAIGRETMSFIQMNVTTSEFLDYATNGHAFCNLFHFDANKKYPFQKSDGQWYYTYPTHHRGNHKDAMKLCMKSDKFFMGAQTVFVDVDYTRFTDVREYLGTLSYPPTCVYMSFSDRKEKKGISSRRFRMVYVFDRVLNEKEFLHVSQTINDQIVFDTGEPMEDDCGTRKSQYMNGVYGNNETYVSDYIYELMDFPEEPPLLTVNPQTTVDTSAPQEITFNDRMLEDMKEMDYDTFMHYYSWRYQYKYRTEYGDVWIDGLYQMTDESYLQLWWYREPQVDGQHRRRKLHKNACLRRLMFPYMDPDTALFDLYVDFMRFFDNSDGVITLDTLIRKVKHAFSNTPEQLEAYCSQEINYWRDHRPQFIVRPGTLMSWGLINNIKSRIRYAELDAMYNRSMSVQENIAAGIGVPQTTLYRYCKERGIDTNPNRPMTEAERRAEAKREKQNDIALFRRLYNPLLSVRRNKDILARNGLDLSEGSISNWSKKYYDAQPTPQTAPTFNFPLIEYELPNFNLHLPTETVEEEKPTEEDETLESYSWQTPRFKWHW